MRPKIIIDDKIPFIRGAFEKVADVEYITGAKISAEDLKNADALITRTRTKCNEKILKGSKVKFIASATIGFDHIDREFCKENGIEWTNAPGCNSGSVLQYVLSTLFAWEKKDNFSIKDKTIGIVGVGNVGSKIASACEFLGMKVLKNDPPRVDAASMSAATRWIQPDGENLKEFCSLEKIIKEADIITFHTPLNRDGKYKTVHLADNDFFTKLSESDKDHFIINTSRGPVIDNSALREALKADKKLHACMDVWENEPNINLELLELCDFASSHIAGYSADGKANGTRKAVQSVSKFLNLGLDSWEPTKPKHDSPLFIDSERNIEEIIRELQLSCYDIAFDTKLIKEQPEEFEFHRGNYRIRRELFTFPVSCQNEEMSCKISQFIKKISF